MDSSLSFAEALRHRDRHQYLVGKTLGKEWGTFSRVVVSPWDEINKHIVFQQFKQTRSEHTSLAFYQVPYFDVSIILERGEELAIADLQTILRLCPQVGAGEKKGIWKRLIFYHQIVKLRIGE